jgi:hypothetical protein
MSVKKWLSAGALSVSLLSAPAYADAPFCVPSPGFVPGAPEGPPAIDGPLDDVHWTGSFRRTHGGNGTAVGDFDPAALAADEVAFRGLVDDARNSAYFSFLMNQDRGQVGLTSGDGITFGWSVDGRSANLIRLLYQDLGAGTQTAVPTPATVYYWDATEATPGWKPAVPQNGWDQKVFVTVQPLGKVDDFGNDLVAWAVQVQVPLAKLAPSAAFNVKQPPGLPVPADAAGKLKPFKFFYQIMYHLSADQVSFYSVPPTPNPQSATNPLPPTDPARYPTIASWSDYAVENNPAYGCAGGVELTSTQIGVVGSNPLQPVSQMHTFDANRFVALPKNKGTTHVPANGIRARFKLADWGSQYNDAAWTEITPHDVGSLSANPSPIAPGESGTIQFPWTAPVPDNRPGAVQPPLSACIWDTRDNDNPNLDARCKDSNGMPILPTKPGHQCMMVELIGQAGVNFTNSSVVRNMDFVHASRFDRDATISIAGLKPLTGTLARDMLLYVDKANMPLKLDRPANKEPPSKDVWRTDPSVIGEKAVQVLKSLPTYRIHTYHETGMRVVESGKAGKKIYRVYEPQTSFGYYVLHEREKALYGWNTELDGAVRVGANLYWMMVLNNSTATVHTAVDALEKPRCDCELDLTKTIGR